jgi:hypothetical protein
MAEAQRQRDSEVQRKSLEELKAKQEEQQRQLEETQRRLAEERAQAAQRERERIQESRRTPVVPPLQPAYHGPSSGEIVWQGVVKGTELITIENGQSSSGSITGGLPGVLVLLQPTDPKKVSIASAPGPRNQYQRMVIRVVGNGSVRAAVRWSLP